MKTGGGETAAERDMRRPSRAEAEEAVRTLILWAGDNPEREGLLDTPRRVAKAWRDMFDGYDLDAASELDTVFEDVGGYSDIVLLRDIPFHSHCEHHILPIIGKVGIAYYPKGGVVGLSKLSRVVDIYSRRLQTQETLTAQILAAIDTRVASRGVAVYVEAEHMCMAMRGIRKLGLKTVTTGFTGLFREDPQERARFMALVEGRAA